MKTRPLIAGIAVGSLALIAGSDHADARTVTGNSSAISLYDPTLSCYQENNSEVQVKSNCSNPQNIPVVTPLPIDNAGNKTVSWTLDGMPGQVLGTVADCFAAAFAPAPYGIGSGWFSSVQYAAYTPVVQTLSAGVYAGSGANMESVCYFYYPGEGLRMVNYNP